jgi:hypothetical protein
VKRFTTIQNSSIAGSSNGSAYPSSGRINEIFQLLLERDTLGRNALDIACFLGYKNIVLYLVSKMGAPSDYL